MLNQVFEFKNLCLTDTKVPNMQLIPLVNLWLNSQSKCKEADSMRKPSPQFCVRFFIRALERMLQTVR